ncbi:MAG: VTT domain-containing protein, partial [Nitrospinota bacterium]|nr:VTT domain-containing protein [Nitrospinota bacterium]
VSAPVLFVIVYALLVALLVPTLPVNLAAGVLWGGLWGGVLATIGGSLGAILAFLFARTSLGQPLAKRYDNRLLKWMTDQLENNTWRVIAFIRLNPAFPSGPVNFLFGLTSVPLNLYAYSSTIFLLPPAIGVAIIGAQAGEIVLSGESIKMFEILTLSLFGILILLTGYWSGKALLKTHKS